jgi:hypothetical protein
MMNNSHNYSFIITKKPKPVLELERALTVAEDAILSVHLSDTDAV